MIKSRVVHGWVLLMLISPLAALQGQGCATPPAPPVTVTRVVTATPSEVMPIPLALNPSKTVLNPEEQVVISVNSEQWQAAELEWKLSSTNKDPGQLSTPTGPAVVYIAPKESGKVDVSVSGRTKGGAIGTATVSFTIQPRAPQGVIEFWTLLPASDWDSGKANEFAKIYPDILVKIVSYSPQDVAEKLQTAIAAGAAPDIVRFFRPDDVQVFGKNRLIDADSATRIIREIGEDKFNPKLLAELRDPDNKNLWLAVPSEQGALSIMIGTNNKSIAEVWVKFLAERELKP